MMRTRKTHRFNEVLFMLSQYLSVVFVYYIIPHTNNNGGIEMAVFKFGKKKVEKIENECSCKKTQMSIDKTPEKTEKSSSIKILGSGCPKCNELESNTKKALEQLGMDSDIEHVRDFAKIAEYGVMSTPALVVEGKVISYGKVLKKDELVKLLGKIRG